MRPSKTTIDLARRIWELPTSDHLDAIQRLRNLEKKLRREAVCQCNGHYADDVHALEAATIKRYTASGYTHSEAWDKFTAWKNNNIVKSEIAEDRLRTQALKIARGVDLHVYFQGDPRGCVLYISKDPIDAHDYNRQGCFAAI
jgi:hypothetical protein